MPDLPVYTKQLPQIWIENDQYIIESSTFKYVINTANKGKRKRSEPLKVLFNLCKRMKTDAIEATYQAV
tara:strand:+ start:562 stop:768 length:207 start_codon:yes stop_codon:yes gene_type:complete